MTSDRRYLLNYGPTGLHETNGAMFKGRQVINPESMRQDILHQLHAGHQGIEKTRFLARQMIYWLNMNRHIDDLVQRCSQCQKHMPDQTRETLIPHEIPVTPWTNIAMDV